MSDIVKLIIAPFVLSVMFLIIAFNDVFAPSPSDRFYFFGASGSAAWHRLLWNLDCSRKEAAYRLAQRRIAPPIPYQHRFDANTRVRAR
jgi:hypothetical protein